MKNEVQHKLNSYPEHIRPLLFKLRKLKKPKDNDRKASVPIAELTCCEIFSA